MANPLSSPLRSPADTPTSSVRASLDIPVSGIRTDHRAASPSPNPTSQRRNRAALRDYYNLQTSNAAARNGPSRTASIASTTSNATTTGPGAFGNQGEVLPLIDAQDFSPESYIVSLMATSSLSSILRAESTLVSEIKNLDGERKALVYDNYSKLIRATETIGQLQKGIDDGAEGGRLKVMENLGPAVERVASTAGDIHNARQRSSGKKTKEINSVKWVLNAPQRLTAMIDEGRGEDNVKAEWNAVRELLETWKNVRGSDEVRQACEAVMRTVGDVNGATG